MKGERLFEALNNLDDSLVADVMKPSRGKTWLWRGVKAACAALILAAGCMLTFSGGGASVTVYAHGTDEEITSVGAVMMGGRIYRSGAMQGHPLMFYLGGKNIEKVRFSCKNHKIRFTDWTEQREEYGSAQNFTVPYGENEDDYYYLTIDWEPDISNIRVFPINGSIIISPLDPTGGEDIIVLEITFLNGDTAVKAIKISLLEDGTFFASFDDYEITEEDDFVSRPDAEPIPRDILYGEN